MFTRILLNIDDNNNFCNANNRSRDQATAVEQTNSDYDQWHIFFCVLISKAQLIP